MKVPNVSLMDNTSFRDSKTPAGQREETESESYDDETSSVSEEVSSSMNTREFDFLHSSTVKFPNNTIVAS